MFMDSRSSLQAKHLRGRIYFLLFFFLLTSKRILLDESPSSHSPGVFSHANRVVKKFSGGVFLVQATGAGRVSGDISRQLKVVIGNLQLVEGVPKLLGIESTLHQTQLESFLDRLGFLSIFRHVIAGLGIGKTGAPSRVQSHCC